MKSDYFESLNFNSNISAIDLMNFNNVFPKIKINDSLDINIEDVSNFNKFCNIFCMHYF